MSLQGVRVKEEADWECASEECVRVKEEHGAREEYANVKVEGLYVEIEIKAEPVLDSEQLQQNDSDFALRAAGKTLSRGAVCTNSLAEKFESPYKQPHTGQTSCETLKQSSPTSQHVHVKESAVKTHDRQPNLRCEMCNQQFMYLSQLNEHKRAHTGETPSKSNVHKRKYNVKKYYSCDVCTKQFSRVASFTKHKIIHTGEKPFSCQFCDKQFYHSSNLNTHTRTHTGERPYTCEFCKKQFTISTHLKLHRRIHTGEKPYPCEVCTKQFIDWSSLERHKRIHTGEKPFGCEVCKKQFSDYSALQRHKRVHTGEKPYTCDVCTKQFSCLANFKRHKLTHIVEKPNSSATT